MGASALAAASDPIETKIFLLFAVLRDLFGAWRNLFARDRVARK
jgi:hypothetical protein